MCYGNTFVSDGIPGNERQSLGRGFALWPNISLWHRERSDQLYGDDSVIPGHNIHLGIEANTLHDLAHLEK